MGIRKLRSVADMPGPPPLPRLDPNKLRIACGLASLAQRLSGAVRKPGVRKFRSWEEALAARDVDTEVRRASR